MPDQAVPDMSIHNGVLTQARQCPSDNYDARPANSPIDLLVIHNISLPPGQFGGDAIDRFFCNQLPADEDPYFASICALNVSSHLLIRRCGEIVQYVNFDQRAWHAGVSEYEGRSRCNDFSIGIELEGSDEVAFESAQYKQLVAVSRALMQAYPEITPQRITGHEHIAPGRKTDPGPHFDWSFYLQQLK